MANILIAEDEWLIAQDLEIVLENLGHKIVASTTSGEDAVTLVNKLHPDIIFMDIKLDGKIDGIDAANKIRIHFDTPIIYCTANTDNGTVEKMNKTKPDGLIIKPFSQKDIEQVISHIDFVKERPININSLYAM